ncbi:MAG: hypothetical protein A3C13_00125 [Candidatus Lloydbacteria bacterium RIFCSPHIGHO2_02_FULL_50_11]|nr:MAG: hypothetical protein A3C13_00125 [Candidatus Lloydbacteria bacterium RIFCSPHIGHO2_02_FULL_50_11]
MFLGVEYILFQYFPIFTLIHAVMGIVIYLIFWRGWFPKLFRDVFIGALIAIISGMMFGDAILDNFFVLYDEAPRGLVSSIYSSLVVFYIYFYVTLVKRTMSRTIS